MTPHSLTLIAAACAGAALLSGCNSADDASNRGAGASSNAPNLPARLDVNPSDVLASVNGKPIPRSAVPQQQRPGPAAGDKMRDELVQRELLRQEAEKEKLLADPAAAEKVDNALRMVISQVAAEHYIENVVVTDDEVKKEYDEKTAALKKTEYKARHIVVGTEAAAREIIAKLQKGAKFDDLAKKLSTDSASKGQGGELGWFASEQMAAPFSTALAGLKNGEVTAAPVQTPAGWEVIQREDFREKQLPAFDQVKDQMRRMLQARKFQQHMEDLKKAAKIEMATLAPSTEHASSGAGAPGVPPQQPKQ